jgi:uncharacterized repeat protein (TIGR01451 family)
MTNINARPNSLRRRYAFILVIAFAFVAAIIAAPVYSARTGLFSRVAIKQGSGNSTAIVRTAALATRSSALANLFSMRASQQPETIATFAADCTTSKSVFTLGEVVCAKTNNVNLSYPEPGRWVDWILTGTTNIIVSGSRSTTRITANPQTFTYTPTQTGVYKVEITQDDGNGGDNPQTPAVFTVNAAPTAPLATYASDCLTAKTSFNLSETVCIKVSGLSNDEWPYRRVQLATPDGFALQRFNVTDNSQQNTYVLPSTENESAGGVTINHIGTWNVSLIDPEANLQETVQITVHKSNLFVDRFADLQLSKFFIDTGDPPTAGTDVTFQVYIFNAGPDPATTVQLSDVTLPNTTFVSFARNTFIASNNIPLSGFDRFAENTATTADLVRFVRDPGSFASSTSFSFMPGDTGATFNCTSPSPGSAGTTTCTADAEVAPGETATFTAVYHVDTSVANGANLSDANSASVTSATADAETESNSEGAAVTTSNPNPPACTLTCPDNITVGTNAVNGQNQPGAIVTFSAAEPAGSCGTITASPASGSFFPVGSTTVTTTASSGPSCSFVVTVVNTAQPTISCPANQTVQAPSGQSEATVSTGTPTYTGSNATLSSHRSDERDVSEPYPIGTTTITWTVTDQYGTTASCNQLITVTSTDAPTITCPSNKTFTAASGECTYTATESQIGTPTTTGPNVTVTHERSDGLALTDPYPAGQTYIEWTATNSVGSASCTQTITVNATDNQAPTLHVPPSITTSTDQCSVLLDEEQFVATAEDNCSSSVNITRTGIPRVACPAPGDPNRTCESFIFPTGTTTITYTATDAAGNSSSGTQTVRVNEDPNITPTINAPADLTLNTGPGATSCGTFVGDATLGTATANDNCPGLVITRTGVPAGNNFPVGNTTVTYTVTDRVGNTAQDTQTVTVIDNTPPVVTAPADVTAYTGPGATSCNTVVSDTTLGTGSATDNCPGVGAVSRTGVPSGNVFPVGTTVITYSATDAHGNTGTATQNVTVVDNTPPVISCPASITLEPTCPSGAIATYVTPTATDNCGVQSVVRTAGGASGTVFPIGTTTVTHQATDIHGNTASCSFTVTVKTPQAVIQDLISRVQVLVNQGALNNANGQSLINRLQDALDYLNAGKTDKACDKMADFIQKTQNFISTGTLTSAQGQPLIDSANKVRNTLGCNNTSGTCT